MWAFRSARLAARRGNPYTGPSGAKALTATCPVLTCALTHSVRGDEHVAHHARLALQARGHACERADRVHSQPGERR